MSENRALRVLMVDDDPDQLAICRAGLERGLPGSTVVCARSGAECLAQIRTGEWDGILLDYKMPGMNGIEILQRVHELRPEIPIILITGYGDEAVAVTAMKQGAVDYVMKSLDYHTILPTVLRRSLEIRVQQRQLEAERTRNIQLATIVQTTRALAHEINNPLQVISGTCELTAVALEAREPELARQVGELVEFCDRIAAVIRRLYTVTHPVTQTRLGMAILDIDASAQPHAAA